MFVVAVAAPDYESDGRRSSVVEGLQSSSKLGSQSDGVSPSELPPRLRRRDSPGATAIARAAADQQLQVDSPELRRVLVTSVESILRQGVYNVHTLSGTVIVNDVSASHFTSSSSWRSSTAKRLALLWYRVLDIVGLVSQSFET